MEIFSGLGNVIAITAIVYIFCLGIKATPLDNKWIPCIAGVLGILLGVLAWYIGMPDYPAEDILTAMAVGGASGLAATGIDQVVKQLR